MWHTITAINECYHFANFQRFIFITVASLIMIHFVGNWLSHEMPFQNRIIIICNNNARRRPMFAKSRGKGRVVSGRGTDFNSTRWLAQHKHLRLSFACEICSSRKYKNFKIISCTTEPQSFIVFPLVKIFCCSHAARKKRIHTEQDFLSLLCPTMKIEIASYHELGWVYFYRQ